MKHYLHPVLVLVALLLVPGCGVGSTDSCDVSLGADSCELTPDQVAACKVILEDVTPIESSRDHTSASVSSIYIQVGNCDQPDPLLEAMDMPGYEFQTTKQGLGTKV